ncbi:hypothetical protein J437_LFUL004934 [Ladona fulva]|uniref:Uncharacterized protein n=1 Tax=Ladona fulva TaxID=123851 RepID=A0A8K0KBS3_LADFU|nr:hypothetical protein J437_LFUL004934 [Ladona fulva]
MQEKRIVYVKHKHKKHKEGTHGLEEMRRPWERRAAAFGRTTTTANAVLSVRPSHAKTPITATASAADPTPPPPVRVTMTSQEEANILLQVGLDFYGATHFPTEAPPQGKKKSVGGGAGVGRGGTGGKGSPGVGTITSYDWGPGTVRRRVRELLPVFDSRFAAASERKVKPRSQ